VPPETPVDCFGGFSQETRAAAAPPRCVTVVPRRQSLVVWGEAVRSGISVKNVVRLTDLWRSPCQPRHQTPEHAGRRQHRRSDTAYRSLRMPSRGNHHPTACVRPGGILLASKSQPVKGGAVHETCAFGTAGRVHIT
jgi:hypothetical protein